MKKLLIVFVVIVISIYAVSCGSKNVSVNLDEILGTLCDYYNLEQISAPAIEEIEITEAYAYARYDIFSNSIQVQKNLNESEEFLIPMFAHELFHYLTAQSANGSFYGLYYEISPRVASGDFLNEGATQYFTEKVFPNQSSDGAAYPNETLFAHQIALIIGEDLFWESYINSKPYLLKNAYNDIAYSIGLENSVTDDGVFLTPFDTLTLMIDRACYVSYGYEILGQVFTLYDVENLILTVASGTDSFDSCYYLYQVSSLYR